MKLASPSGCAQRRKRSPHDLPRASAPIGHNLPPRPHPPADPRPALAQCWRDAFGSDPAPAVLDWIVQRGVAVCGLGLPLLREAIQMTALRCAGSPVDYLTALLRDWRLHGIRTPEQLEEYLEARAA